MNDTLHLMLHALVFRAGQPIEVTQGDVAEIPAGSTLVIDYDPRRKKWIMRVSGAPIQETATIVEQKALPAP